MDSSDSLKLDEHLARFLAAYDQNLDGGDGRAPTVQVRFSPEDDPELTTERPVTPLHPEYPNQGSLTELLPDPSAPLAPQPAGGPHRVGRFELRRQLGKGGCGIVFLAYDPRMRREVALKVPRPEMLMNADAKRRLKLEALAASEFDHPNLVPVYEWGEVGPLCFIATAFCPGQTLAEWIDRQAFPVPVRQAARLVATVADAVQHAHDRGVLHRDLKPNNVILQEVAVNEGDEPPAGAVPLRGAHYIPRVVDFGLAKVSDRGGPSETGTRQVLGTPKYMAPEQAQARREDIGPPADVYALGVVLYELLAGRAPYDGATDVEVLRQAVEGRAPAPRTLRADLPRDLEAICLKAMARTTAQRYRTAIDLADDLRRFLDGRPTIARPLAWAGRAGRWLRRNDQLVAVAVLTVIALAVTVLGTWNSYKTRNLQSDHANVLRDRDRTDQQREYARQVRDAHLALRGGNARAAADALEAARRAAGVTLEAPEFAHGYLTRLARGEAAIACPAGAVTALAVSPDGARLASGHADGSVAMWDRATGAQLGAARAGGEVRRVEFALGGALLLAGRADAPGVRGWAVAKDGALADAPPALRAPAPDAECFAVSPDGGALYTGGRDGAVSRRALGRDEPATVVRGGGASVRAVAAADTRDGPRVFAADAAGAVRGYSGDLRPGAGAEHRAAARVTALGATADGVPAIGTADGVELLAPGVPAGRVAAGGPVRWVASAPGSPLAFSGTPGRVRLGAYAELPTGDAGEVTAGAYSPDGKTLFTGGADGVIRAWAFPEVRARLAVATGAVRAVGVAPASDGGRFVLATDGGLVEFDGAEPGRTGGADGRKCVAVRLLGDGSRRAVAFDAGAAVVSSSDDAGREPFRAAPPGGRAAATAALTPDGRVLAVGDAGGRVTVWAVGEPYPAGLLDTGVPGPVGAVALSDDGRLAAARAPGGVGVWAVGAPEPRATVAADEGAVFRLLPGDRLATAGRDGVVRVWSAAGREELVLFGHVGRVTALGVSPDGRTLVSGSATGDVRFWDLKAGTELLAERRHSVAVTRIEFAADGRYMVSAGDGQVAVWDAR